MYTYISNNKCKMFTYCIFTIAVLQEKKKGTIRDVSANLYYLDHINTIDFSVGYINALIKQHFLTF